MYPTCDALRSPSHTYFHIMLFVYSLSPVIQYSILFSFFFICLLPLFYLVVVAPLRWCEKCLCWFIFRFFFSSPVQNSTLFSAPTCSRSPISHSFKRLWIFQQFHFGCLFHRRFKFHLLSLIATLSLPNMYNGDEMCYMIFVFFRPQTKYNKRVQKIRTQQSRLILTASIICHLIYNMHDFVSTILYAILCTPLAIAWSISTAEERLHRLHIPYDDILKLLRTTHLQIYSTESKRNARKKNISNYRKTNKWTKEKY